MTARSLLLRAWLLVALPGSAQAPDILVLDSGRPGPRMLVVGGIHGDEPSGALAAKGLAGPKRGVLTVIPAANPPALAAHTRSAPAPSMDLNRAFPGQGEGREARQAAAIYAVAVVADLVLDLHEEGPAWNEADLPTLVVSPAAAAFALELLETLNARTPHFTFTGGAPAGSLVGALGKEGRRALVVEVPARLPLPDRIELHGRVIAAALDLLGMR